MTTPNPELTTLQTEIRTLIGKANKIHQYDTDILTEECVITVKGHLIDAYNRISTYELTYLEE